MLKIQDGAASGEKARQANQGLPWPFKTNREIEFTSTHLLSPVTLLTTFLTILGGRMSSFKTLDSVASGNPLSNISSNNCKVKTIFQPTSHVPSTISQTFL